MALYVNRVICNKMFMLNANNYSHNTKSFNAMKDFSIVGLLMIGSVVFTGY